MAVPLSMPVLGYHGVPILTGIEETKLKRLKEERIMCLWRSSQRRRMSEKEKVCVERKKLAVVELETGEVEERKEETTMRVLGEECCCSHYSVYLRREEQVKEDKKSV